MIPNAVCEIPKSPLPPEVVPQLRGGTEAAYRDSSAAVLRGLSGSWDEEKREGGSLGRIDRGNEH